jgi:uncharacterized protein YecE (DUF72 family)
MRWRGYLLAVAVIIGTSGWQYTDWRAGLYPVALAPTKWLSYYSERFQSVEVNNVFYRLPERSTFERWYNSTPDDFVFSLKASRYLTHVLRLSDPAEPVQRLLGRSKGLGHKMGPVLLQLPENFQANPTLLALTLGAFSSDVRVAFEPRHESWYSDEVADILTQHQAALCLSDTPRRKSPLWRTADWGYLRLHQGRANPAPCYGRTALRNWAARLAELWDESEDVYVYFNNDHGGCAVRDARRFALASAHAGLSPTRVPTSREASLTVEG